MGFFDQGNQSEKERLHMVDKQLVARGISDEQVLDAMRNVPREVFVPAKYRHDAFNDGPLPIGKGQTISQPYMVALMTECLNLTKDAKVLEIGTGSGYQMAVLLRITPYVYSIERIAALAENAQNTLVSLGYESVNIKVGDGTCGWPEQAPFDGIIVTSGAPSITETLKEQLADGGRLIIPVGTRHTQTLYKITRTGNRFNQEEITCCVFVPLIGKYGWEDN